jgi:hypothetical protein
MKLSLYLFNYAPRHRDVWGTGNIAPRILNLSTRLQWVVSTTSGQLYPQYRKRKLGGAQSRSARSGEEKDFLPLSADTVTRRYTDWAIPALARSFPS